MASNDREYTELVQSYLKMVADQDFRNLGDLLTDDCGFTLVPSRYTWRGQEEIVRVLIASAGSGSSGSGPTVRIVNSFAQDQYVVVEYSREAKLGAFTVNIDGYCWIAHIRGDRFDSIREYINPSNPVIAVAMAAVMRLYPRMVRGK